MEKYSQNALNILAMLECKKINNQWIVETYKKDMDTKTLEDTLKERLKDCNFSLPDEIEKVKNYLDTSGDEIRFVAFGDEEFPDSRFRQIPTKSDLPLFLAYKGDLNLLHKNNFNIAVIGLLNPTLEIELLEKAVLREILKFDVTIVSGLAFGCDSIAHNSVSDKNCTIAVLPSTLDDILPKKMWR